jgi:hypothetical protein
MREGGGRERKEGGRGEREGEERGRERYYFLLSFISPGYRL